MQRHDSPVGSLDSCSAACCCYSAWAGVPTIEHIPPVVGMCLALPFAQSLHQHFSVSYGRRNSDMVPTPGVCNRQV
jgi:hypothetical protein